MRGLLPALIALLLMVASRAEAHEMRPAYLEVTTAGPRTRVSLVWGAKQAAAAPRLRVPDACRVLDSQRSKGRRAWHLACDVDSFLSGARLELNPFTPDAVVRVSRDTRSQTYAVDRNHPRLVGEVRATTSFLRLGFLHILGGVDHLLFILGLVLLVVPVSGQAPLPVRRLALSITAFTVAHSVTLALSVLNVAVLPPAGVEAAIAASLVLLALEVLGKESTWSRRHPQGVAFAFGLLHGFGFAGALRASGLPPDGVAGALLAFNVGVEIGQLAFLAGCLAVLWGLHRVSHKTPWVAAGAYVVGALGMVWFLKRSAPVVFGGFS